MWVCVFHSLTECVCLCASPQGYQAAAKYSYACKVCTSQYTGGERETLRSAPRPPGDKTWPPKSWIYLPKRHINRSARAAPTASTTPRGAPAPTGDACGALERECSVSEQGSLDQRIHGRTTKEASLSDAHFCFSRRTYQKWSDMHRPTTPHRQASANHKGQQQHHYTSPFDIDQGGGAGTPCGPPGRA